MRRWSLLLCALTSLGWVPQGRAGAGAGAEAEAGAGGEFSDLEHPAHRYTQRTPRDRFTLLKPALESGQAIPGWASDKDFLVKLLNFLSVPASSQMLVFSTTSLQLSLISPANPRAIYFSEDLYVGYVPGGRMEIIGLDPELGGIYHIFDLPQEQRGVRVERSERCMKCHAGAETGHVPGLVIKSVVPGPGGGSLTAYRLEQTGHAVPFADRFGGWHVTGRHSITQHWGNLTGQLAAGKLTTVPNPPGVRFDFERYPVAGSDILPQLLLEHQVGFVNRVVGASYRARFAAHAGNGRLTSAQATELDEQAGLITRYLLFAEEAPLPAGGVEGDALFKAEFLQTSRAVHGASLKEFDLRTRLFKHRCSYMIYSPVFTGLPAAMKERVYRRLDTALRVGQADPDYAYLPPAEKQAIRGILRGTLGDLPRGW